MAKRNINVEGLSDEQLEAAIQKISSKINGEVATACDNANALLNRYGLRCRMQMVIEQSEVEATAESVIR